MLNPADAECVRALDITLQRRQGNVIVADDDDNQCDANFRYSALKAALAAHARGEFADAERLAREVVNQVDSPAAATSAARLLLASFLISRAMRDDGDKNPKKEAGKILAKIAPDDCAVPSRVMEMARTLSNAAG